MAIDMTCETCGMIHPIGQGYCRVEALQKAEAEVARLRAVCAAKDEALQAHHDWHLARGDEIFEDGAGGYTKVDMADAYSDSNLCDKAVAALSSDGSKVIAVVHHADMFVKLKQRRMSREFLSVGAAFDLLADALDALDRESKQTGKDG